MAFVSILADEHEIPPIEDIKIIISLGMCIIFGFITTLTSSYSGSIVCLVLSCLANLYAMKIALIDRVSKISSLETLALPTGDESIYKALVVKAVQNNRLTQFLLFVLPPFPILYFLCLFKSISNDQMYVGIIIANVLAKFLFTSRYQ